MAALDDRELEQLAAETARPLFPILNAAEAMFPLVVVLAFLPALYAVVHGMLTEPGALQGLASLRMLSTADVSGPASPAGFDRLDQLRFQPPLMTWLTAVCLKSFGIGHAAGLVASSYLCTAGLLLAVYALGRRLGSERLGLVAVLLLAFNPMILAGAQQPNPQSAAGLFAVLALAGVIAHWQKASSLTSYQLLLGGIALGLCLLAGGPMALAVVAILIAYIAIWKLEALWRRKNSGIVWDRSQFSRRTAFRSAAVLVATAFALSGWQVLLFSSRFGAEFWSRWFDPPRSDFSTLMPVEGRSWLVAACLEINLLALPVWGLSLVGLAAVIHDAWHGNEDPARRHRLILFPWIIVAIGAWVCVGGVNSPDDPSARMWATWLAIPLVIAAALGLIEIAERRVGFLAAVAAGLLSLFDVAVFAGWPVDAQGRVSGLQIGSRSMIFDNPSLILAATLLTGLAAARFAHTSELRRRNVLAVLLAAIVLGNCWWGASTIGRVASNDREVDDLRAGLSKLSPVDRFIFVAPARGVRSPAEQPPARLVYGLASLWPDAQFDFAESWEAAISRTNPESTVAAAGSAAFVAWSPRGLLRGSSPDPTLKPVAPPALFQGLEVVVYVRDAARIAGGDNSAQTRSSVDSR